jgi:hypothetical protein
VGGAAGLRLFLIEHDLQGLPSGHMTSAHDALDQAARLQARRGGQIRHLQRIFAPEESTLTAAVCLSRVYLGAHFPVDVAAGAGLGLFIGSALNLVFGVPSASTAGASG